MPATKPEKPYAEYPLFAHASGQWCRKIKGKFYYFGKWENWEAALKTYREQVDYLQLGVEPPAVYTTLGEVLNSYLSSKKDSLDIKDIDQRTYDDYVRTCDIVARLGKHRPFESLNSADLSRLRTMLAKGTKGQLLSPISHKRRLTDARMVFYHANQQLGFNLRYLKSLAPPSKKKIRERTNAIGERMFEAAEIRTLLKEAEQPLKSLIYLGINCGFGPKDCVFMTADRFILGAKLHNFPRIKNGVCRECSLWQETVKSLQEIMPPSGRLLTGRKWTRHIIATQFKERLSGYRGHRPTHVRRLREDLRYRRQTGQAPSL